MAVMKDTFGYRFKTGKISLSVDLKEIREGFALTDHIWAVSPQSIRSLNIRANITITIAAPRHDGAGGIGVGVGETGVAVGVAVETGEGGVRDGVTVGISLFNS